MDLYDPFVIAFALIIKLLNSMRINRIIRKIRKALPSIVKSPFTALVVNCWILSGSINFDI